MENLKKKRGVNELIHKTEREGRKCRKPLLFVTGERGKDRLIDMKIHLYCVIK